MTVEIRSAYGPRVRVVVDTGDKSMTKQSMSDACDINKIMAKYERTGVITHARANAGFYADVSAVGDYHAAVLQVQAARDLFMSLPAQLRSRFDNDPGKYLDFVTNPENRDELVKMGLMKPPATAPAQPAPEPVADAGTGEAATVAA